MGAEQGSYYVPHSANWPLLGSFGLFFTLMGFASWLHVRWYGVHLMVVGAIMLVVMMFGWFADVIRENQQGLYDEQVDKSFRIAMMWFIFTEVCFFGAFFAALFYTRVLVVPFIGGEHSSPLTHYLLWPNFKNIWPVLVNPDNQLFLGPHEAMPAWGLPALNTLILLTSGLTITWAHWGLEKENRRQLKLGLFLTILLGVTFLYCQATEYMEAYQEFGLTLASGIYGTTFFMLTGFHGAHVTIGTIMLIVIFLRACVGHFTPQNHFAFEGVAWYWHFVDVVWLFLFIFVYWL